MRPPAYTFTGRHLDSGSPGRAGVHKPMRPAPTKTRTQPQFACMRAPRHTTPPSGMPRPRRPPLLRCGAAAHRIAADDDGVAARARLEHELPRGGRADPGGVARGGGNLPVRRHRILQHAEGPPRGRAVQQRLHGQAHLRAPAAWGSLHAPPRHPKPRKGAALLLRSGAPLPRAHKGLPFPPA